MTYCFSARVLPVSNISRPRDLRSGPKVVPGHFTLGHAQLHTRPFAKFFDAVEEDLHVCHGRGAQCHIISEAGRVASEPALVREAHTSARKVS
eukprot:3580524-Rhodomonas_salina.1